MNYAYPLQANRRPPRFRLAETTPAVLEFEDSHTASTELQVVSRTGGLLAVPKPLDEGLLCTLMFRTHKGLVFATAEMLSPLSWNRQPFRFIELKQDDHQKLQAAFLTGVYRNLQEEEWIEEFRSAILTWDPPRARRHLSKAVITALTVATLCASVLFYAFSAHLH